MTGKRMLATAAFALLCVVPLHAGAETADEWTEAAEQKTETDPSAALAAIDRAIALEDAAYRRYDRAMILKKLGRNAESLKELEKAHALDANNAVIDFDLAYAYRDAGRNDEAAALFAAGNKLDPSNYEIIEDWAYALKDAGRRKEAEAKFRQAIRNRALYPQKTEAERDALERRMWNLRREVGMLEKYWYASGYFAYRSPNTGLFSPLAQESGLAGSMAGVEAGWRPLGTTTLEVYGRTYFSFQDDALRYDDKSLQFGVGVRWRPFEEVDFSLAAERMIKAGDNARDDWLLQAAYYWGDGVEFDPVAASWNYTTVYGELDYIPGNRHFVSLYGQGIEGWRFRLAPYWALTPHVVLAGTRTDDNGTVLHLVEAGPGVMLTRLLCADEESIPDSQVSLSLQYRFVLEDNIDARNATVVMLEWSL